MCRNILHRGLDHVQVAVVVAGVVALDAQAQPLANDLPTDFLVFTARGRALGGGERRL